MLIKRNSYGYTTNKKYIAGRGYVDYLSNKTGAGFNLNNLINNLPIELHLFAEKGEDVPEGSFNGQRNYSLGGPGTRYDQIVKKGYKEIKTLDSLCKLHDQFYSIYTDTQSRNIADIALAHGAQEIARNPIFDEQQRKDANFVVGLMRSKARFGLGLHGSKQKKTGLDLHDDWNEDLADELHKPIRRNC